MTQLPYQLDVANMRQTLIDFPAQVQSALTIGEKAPLLPNGEAIQHIAFFGMGGSAIGADILRSYLAALGEARLMTIHRGYSVPPYLSSSSLAIAGSYSGTTEETLSAFEQARQKTSLLYAQTSGGTLAQIATESGIPFITLPTGFQPRCALGYSFFPLLHVFVRSGILSPSGAESTVKAFAETLGLLQQRAELYSTPAEDNPAFAIAKALHGSVPVFYSSEILETVQARWRGQIHENAKQLAFGSIVPEMNHNEINSWSEPHELLSRFVMIFLRDAAEHPRVALRFKAMEQLLKTKPFAIIEVEGMGDSLLARMFDSMYLADWTSYYLALLNNADPTAIPIISGLKNILSKQ